MRDFNTQTRKHRVGKKVSRAIEVKKSKVLFEDWVFKPMIIGKFHRVPYQ